MRNLKIARILKWTAFGFILNCILTTIFLQGLVDFNDSTKYVSNKDKKFYVKKTDSNRDFQLKIQHRLNRTFMNYVFGERDIAYLVKSRASSNNSHYSKISSNDSYFITSTEKLSKDQEISTDISTKNVPDGILHSITDKISETLTTQSAKYLTYLKYLKSSVLSMLPIQNYMKQDRILKQLRYKQEELSYKTILLYAGFTTKENMVQYMNTCEVKKCKFIADRKLLWKADAVFFNAVHLNVVNTLTKPLGQIWVFNQLESSQYNIADKRKLGAANSKFNFTATYRRDSVIVTPYEKFMPYTELKPENSSETNKYEVNNRNYAANKTKMVAWFVSNCNARNGRNEYVKELQNYISVDIYGRCGPLKCARKKASTCFDMLDNDYKFYLAFENSNCVDYITEKLYWNALNNDVVPVVMGARKEDYDAVVPPHSVIHVDDFESPKELAKYLKMLSQNDALYNEYFKWKGTGEFINTKMWCRLCALIHATEHQKMYYKNLYDWWNPNGICVRPNGKLWSTWRNVSSPIKFEQLTLL